MLSDSRFIFTLAIALLLAIGGFTLLALLLSFWEKQNRKAAAERRLQKKD